MAQISFSFSGGFWPISFPLFHGTARSLALETVLVSAYMNGSFVVERSPILNVDQGRLSTRSGSSVRRKAVVAVHASGRFRSSTACWMRVWVRSRHKPRVDLARG